VDVETTAAGQIEDSLAQDLTVRSDDKDVRVKRPQRFDRVGVADLIGLKDGEVVGEGRELHWWRRGAMASARRTVGLGDSRGDIVPSASQGFESRQGKRRRAKEDDTHRSRS
jgi:hypothetical protein